MKRNNGLLTLFLLLSLFSMAETNRHKEIYHAYISGDISRWISVVREMEGDANIRTVGQKLELIEYYYGLAGNYLGHKNDKMARITIQKADVILDKLLKIAPKNATVHAYKGSFTGYKISLDKYKAITLGAESLKYINEAYLLDPLDPQALTDKGNALYHAPGIFGGNKTEAINFFLKSIAQMEKSNRATDNWFYLNTLVQTAKAYIAINQPDKARLIYEKALRKEPDFLWVRNKLYPELLKSTTN